VGEPWVFGGGGGVRLTEWEGAGVGDGALD